MSLFSDAVIMKTSLQLAHGMLDTLQYLKFFKTLIPSNSRKTGEFLRYRLEAMTEVNVYTCCGWFYSEPSLRRPISRWHRNEPWPRYFSVTIVFARQQWNLRRQRRNFTRWFFLYHGHTKSCGKKSPTSDVRSKWTFPAFLFCSGRKQFGQG